MEAALVMIICILVMVIIVALRRIKELSSQLKMRDLVSWSVSKGDHIRCNLPLFSYIANAQIHLNIPQEYRISGDEEWGYAKDILLEYQKDLSQLYITGCISTKILEGKYAVMGEDYFMFSLQSFLADHLCDSKFLEYSMRDERLEYKEYGSWGRQLYDATYSLTDFSVVYNKMHYISYLFCKNNESINKNGEYFHNERFIKERLDTGKIQISQL